MKNKHTSFWGIISGLLISSTLFYSCKNTSEHTNTDKSANETFDNYKNRFVDQLWTIYPSWATSQGKHDYDSILVLPTQQQRDKELAFVKAHIDSLKNIELSTLSDNNKIDWEMMQNFLQSTVWSIETFKSYEWNPSNYNIGGDIGEILNNKKATLTEKTNNALKKLIHLKEFYEAAKSNIKVPTREHTDLAIAQLQGTINFFETSVADSVKKANADLTILKNAIEQTNSFVDYLQGLKKEHEKNNSFKDFRIGEKLYEQKFAYDIQSALTAKELYEKAISRKNELNNEMAKVADRLWLKYMKGEKAPTDKNVFIKTLINKIALTHIKREDFQKEIERQIPILTAFVKEKDLLFMDPAKPLVVRKEPEWMAGVAGASISAPGPYDKEGNTFYNVGSLANYTPENAESYLREYNKYILQILNIHEAIPGHYAQLIYSNQSPSIIKTIFSNGAMVEGWAVYTERMMLEEGWAKNTAINGIVEEDEMWLMYYKWHMRVVCNTILDYSMHVLGMSKEEGLILLMNEAFQEKAEAENKWKRATLTQVQLCSYFSGYTDIYNLREELKKKQGKDFKLKLFHEAFLSYGSAPVKYSKDLLLK